MLDGINTAFGRVAYPRDWLAARARLVRNAATIGELQDVLRNELAFTELLAEPERSRSRARIEERIRSYRNSSESYEQKLAAWHEQLRADEARFEETGETAHLRKYFAPLVAALPTFMQAGVAHV